MAQPQSPSATDPVWTPRQREVLQLLMRRQTNGQIAEALGITLDGAKWHVREIITRLGVESREEAAEYWRAHNGLRPRFTRALRALLPASIGLKVAAGGVGLALAAGAAAFVLVALHQGGGASNATPSTPPATTTPGSVAASPATVNTAPPVAAAWPPANLASISHIETRQGHPCCGDSRVLDAANSAEQPGIDRAVSALRSTGPLAADDQDTGMLPFLNVTFYVGNTIAFSISPAYNCHSTPNQLSCVPAEGDFWVAAANTKYRFHSEQLQAWFDDLMALRIGHNQPWQPP